MKSTILLLVLSAVILGSCTSAYKSGQTPDDVYFSPQRQQDKYVNVKEKDDEQYQGDDYSSYDDHYLRMKVHNRVMWSDLDDYYFYNPRYSYSYYYNLNNPWSPYTYWNYYYNPYCSPVISTHTTGMAYNHPRMFNLNTYNSTQLTNNNYSSPKGSSYNSSMYNNYNSRPVRIVGYTPNNNSGSSGGNFLRNIFNSSSNSSNSSSNNSSYSPSSRSSSSSSSGSSSSSSGGGGGSAPVRRF
jgi:hypothetical protein